MPRNDHYEDITVSGTVSLGAQSRVEGNLTPDTDDNRTLGDATHRWQRAYFVNDPAIQDLDVDTVDFSIANPDVRLSRAAANILQLGAGDSFRIVPASSTVAITSSSVANPSVITTAVAHGLDDTQQVRIVGHANSTPDINTWWEITLINSTTFSIPVNVTVGGTGGTLAIFDSTEPAIEFSLPNAGGTDPRWELLLTEGGSLAIAYKDGATDYAAIEVNRAPSFGMGFHLPAHGNDTNGGGFDYKEGSDPGTRHFFLRTRAPAAGGTAPATHIEFGNTAGELGIGRQAANTFGIYSSNDTALVVAEGPSADADLKFQPKGTGNIRIDGPIIVSQNAPTVGAGNLGIGKETATSATAGANGDVPAQVVGYLIFNLAGSTIKVPYYNS